MDLMHRIDSASMASGMVVRFATACMAIALACAFALPVTAAAAETLVDGTYDVPVTLEGGSGRASLEPTAGVVVEDGAITATLVFSSSNYDLMVVDGIEYTPTTTDPGSTFVVPVASLDEPLAVSAETTAMGNSHMIDYTVLFDASSVISSAGAEVPVPIIVGAIVAVLAVAIAVYAVVRSRVSKKQEEVPRA